MSGNSDPAPSANIPPIWRSPSPQTASAAVAVGGSAAGTPPSTTLSDTSRIAPSNITAHATEPVVAQSEGVSTFESIRAEEDSAQLQRAWPQRIHSAHPNTAARTYGHTGPPGSAGYRPPPPTGHRSGGNARRAGDGPTQENSRMQGGASSGPQRPSYVPSLDSSRTVGLNNFAPRPAPDYWEENSQKTPNHPAPRSQPRSGSSSSPHGQPGASSWRSTLSSTSSLSDFPYPGLVSSSRKSGNANAAPMRKGNSSYYSQYSYVSPIPEEDPTANTSHHGSFASSRVIPSSWGSGLSEDAPSSDAVDDGRGHRGGPGPSRLREEDEANSITATEFIMSYEQEGGSGQTGQQSENNSPVSDTGPLSNNDLPGPLNASSPNMERTHEADPAGMGMTVPALQVPGKTSPPRKNGVTTPTRSVDASTPNEHYDTASSMRRTHSTRSSLSGHSRAPILPTDDPRAQQILHGLQKGTSLDDQSTSTTSQAEIGVAARVERQPPRRPPRLTLDTATKEPEMRSSLTSLPELIKRATRLASVLDRGRPASQLRLDIPQEKDEHRDVRVESPAGRKPASIAEMLAYFPTPGTREGANSRSSGYPARNPLSASPAGGDASRGQDRSGRRRKSSGRRKICGIPFWSFVVLMAMAVIIIIAAVVLPLTFVVIIPRHNRPQIMSTLADCERRLECLNGGTNVFEGRTCRCICVSGFTGDRCATAPTGSCATADFQTGTSNMQGVTVGSAIPRLLRQGPQAFNVPLSVATILSMFSSANQSCNLQNALVTFNGRSMPSQPESPSASSSASSSSRTGPQKRQLATASNPSPTPPASSVPATSTFRLATASPTDTRSTPTSASTSASTAPFVSDETALDFARVSVLYILQQSSMERAVYAQQRLQNFLGGSNTQGGSRVTVGDGVGVDLRERTIIFVNGTVVGGGKGSIGS